VAAIEIQGLEKSFGPVQVLRDINLSIGDGEFLALVGPSGCGKSTMLRLLAGLETANAGRIFIGGRDVTDLPAKARDIAMVFQSYALYPHMTVAENMAFSLRVRKADKALIEERVKAAAALGAKVRTLTDWFDTVYKVREPTLVEAMQKLTFNADGPYGGTPTPKSFEHNFVAEDVPVGLIPMVALGKAAGVAMPAMQTLIDYTCLMTGDDYAKNARTLERMGLAGKDANGIIKVVEHGFG